MSKDYSVEQFNWIPQDSHSQSGFPLLVVLVWFLPLFIHMFDSAAVRYLRPIFTGIEDLDATHSIYIDQQVGNF